ncbi:hypothetical protein ABZ916_32000 [Streptomyces sp. NPDC046853]|uniref:hypothetical protein n=1 Tax=Streptomyces sp. NPDC046853 TaxID=3154920 RepID=UPI0033FFA311
MRLLPLNPERWTSAMLMQVPEPKLKNKKTEEKAYDTTTGELLMSVNVALINLDGKPDVDTFVIPESGIADGLVPGTQVMLVEPFGRPWENEFGHGITYRATAVMAASVPAMANGKD